MGQHKISIQGLEVNVRIGVPDEERARPQRLLIDVEITPQRPFAEMKDEVDRTVDYHLVSTAIAQFAATHEFRLIETLADRLADLVMSEAEVKEVRVQVRKFVLPQTEWVAVSVEKLLKA